MADRTDTKRHRNGWTPARRARQAALIRTWRPWTRSTGPKTAAGKMRTRLNAQTHGFRGERGRAFHAAIRDQRKFLLAINRLASFLDSSPRFVRPRSESLQNPPFSHMVPATGDKAMKTLPQMQKTVIAAGLALSALFATAAQAYAETSIPANLVPTLKCFTSMGERVQYHIPSPAAFAKSGGVLAAATRLEDANRTPAIFIDSDLLPKLPPELQNFVLAHECAHHENGDMDNYPKDLLTESIFQKIEDGADCRAAQRLRGEKNYGDKEFGIVARGLVSVMQQANAPTAEIRARLGKLNLCLGYK